MQKSVKYILQSSNYFKTWSNSLRYNIIIKTYLKKPKKKQMPNSKTGFYSWFRTQFATICRCTIGSCGCKTKERENLLGGWSTPMPSLGNQHGAEPLPWKLPNMRRSEGEWKRRYAKLKIIRCLITFYFKFPIFFLCKNSEHDYETIL